MGMSPQIPNVLRVVIEPKISEAFREIADADSLIVLVAWITLLMIASGA